MTLIEVLLALIIFGVGILSIMAALSQTISSLQESRLQTQATMLAKEAIDLTIYHKNQNSNL
jgi:Tfp pilus assembly protein PilV